MAYGGTNTVGAVLVTTALVFLSATVLWRRKKSKVAVPVLRGEIDKILIYPIKSCHGISVQSAKCTPTGLQHGILRDRSFMIRDTETKMFIQLVDNPSTVLIRPELCDDGKAICVNAPGMETLRLDIEELDRNKGALVEVDFIGATMSGYDCGDKYAEWFQTFLKNPNLRLIYMGSNAPPTRGKEVKGYGRFMKKSDVYTYSYLTPFSVYSESSLDDLNKRLKNPASIMNFRPNITVSGTEPYEEDMWDIINIGEEAIMQVRLLCPRCAITTVNAENGTKDHTVMTTLYKYRKCKDEYINKATGYVAPLIGLDVGFEKAGTINVGDPVYVTYK